jgi:hypothetical protein
MTDLVPVNEELDTAALPPGLQSIREAIGAALDDLNALDAAGDLDGLLVGIAVLDIIRRDLGVLRSAAGTAASGHMDSKMIALEGVGLFEKKADVKRTTDWDELLKEIRRRSLVDTDTGEVVEDPQVAVDRCLDLIRTIVPLYRSTSAKQGGLTGAGIDKDRVQDSEWKAANVVYKGKK